MNEHVLMDRGKYIERKAMLEREIQARRVKIAQLEQQIQLAKDELLRLEGAHSLLDEILRLESAVGEPLETEERK